jgi:hypothetical protein
LAVAAAVASREGTIERLQRQLMEAAAKAHATTEGCRERAADARGRVDRRQAEVAALAQMSETRAAQLVREYKILAAIEERMRECERVRDFHREDSAVKYGLAKMNYADARAVFEQRWKAAKRAKRTADAAAHKRGRKRVQSPQFPKESTGGQPENEREEGRTKEDTSVIGDDRPEKRPETAKDEETAVKGDRRPSVLGNSPKIVRPAMKQKLGKAENQALAKQQIPVDS